MKEGWNEIKFGEVLKVSSGKGLPRSKQDSHGTCPVYGGNGVMGHHSEYMYADSKLIIGRVGAQCGNTHITSPNSWITDNAFVADFDEKLYDKQFLWYLIQEMRLIRYSKSTAQPVISGRSIYGIRLDLPPLPEQRAIVAKLERLFAELDRSVAELEAAREKLGVYRQRVLKEAFSGRLTEGWRVLKDVDFDYPSVKIGTVSKVGTGATPKRGNPLYWKNGNIPWITSGALNSAKVTQASDFITEVAIKETNASIFPKHTLLIAMYGEGKTRGKCAELLLEAATNQAIAGVELDTQMAFLPFVKYSFERMYHEIRTKSSGGVQPNLNLTIIRNIEIPLPAIDEQMAIVDEIETRFSVADKLEQEITENLERARGLRQGVLKRAFAGELVH